MRRARSSAASGRLPNFFVVGAHKSGTTAVARFLDLHPEVFVSPVKEPRYFALAGDEREFTGPDDPASRFAHGTEEAYRALFSGVVDESAVGEASTLYLYHPAAAENIASRIPDARVMAVLRHPVERAYSNFLHCRRDGQEPREDFLDALKDEKERIERGWGPLWHYQRRGRYAAQIRRYLESFPAERILVVTHDELERDPAGILRRMYAFLGVDAGFAPDTGRRWNAGGVPYSVTLQRALELPNPLRASVAAILPTSAKTLLKRLVRRANLRPAPALPRDLRDALTRHLYMDEIHATEEVTGLPVVESWLPEPFGGREIGRSVEARVREIPRLRLGEETGEARGRAATGGGGPRSSARLRA